MAKISRYRMSRTRSNDTVCRIVADAEVKSTMMLTAGRYEGRRVELDGRMLYNFGTCSYMGLDKNRELRGRGHRRIHLRHPIFHIACISPMSNVRGVGDYSSNDNRATGFSCPFYDARAHGGVARARP
jgi:hypothetical protein